MRSGNEAPPCFSYMAGQGGISLVVRKSKKCWQGCQTAHSTELLQVLQKFARRMGLATLLSGSDAQEKEEEKTLYISSALKTVFLQQGGA